MFENWDPLPLEYQSISNRESSKVVAFMCEFIGNPNLYENLVEILSSGKPPSPALQYGLEKLNCLLNSEFKNVSWNKISFRILGQTLLEDPAESVKDVGRALLLAVDLLPKM